MPIGLSAALGATALAGGLTAGSNAISQAWSQRFNADQAQISRDFNADQAQISRDWSKEMASTAYQRQVEDMKKAGINPALLMGGTAGASSGQAVNASSSPVGSYPLSSGLSSIFNTALQATLLKEPKTFSRELTNELYNVKQMKLHQTSNSALSDWQKERLKH